MNINDIKLYAFNVSAMALTFTNIEEVLKLILLTASIIYTILKIVEMKTKKSKNENNK
jgi:hypothetical protein